MVELHSLPSPAGGLGLASGILLVVLVLPTDMVTIAIGTNMYNCCLCDACCLSFAVHVDTGLVLSSCYIVNTNLSEFIRQPGSVTLR